MKLNVLLPWICVLGLSAGLASVWVASRAKDSELGKLRAEAAQVQQARTDLEEAQAQTKRQADQITDLRKDTQELLSLRSEVGQLRKDKLALTKQVQTVQSQAQLAQSQTEQAVKTGNAKAMEVARLQAEMEARLKANPQGNGCLNNLRMLDAAKQQWALEFSKPANAVPTAAEILPYLPGNVPPVCPSGGTYLVNAVNVRPTCSFPGHVLP